jgi:two-component system response regulator RegX3
MPTKPASTKQPTSTTGPAIPILVVEDEPAIRTGLCDVLAFHGYAPHGEERGDEGLTRGLSESYALVILDIMLPGLDGFEICERLRETKPQVPILMLTARGSEEDVLRGFRCGADDYVTKPFSLAQLVARVEALLRRGGALGDEESQECFPFGAWEIDGGELSAQRDGHSLELTRREVAILSLFVREKNRIVSRRRLLHDVWGYENPERVETRTVDMHIVKLRKKLAKAAGKDARSKDSPIETVRGEGYRYRE